MIVRYLNRGTPSKSSGFHEASARVGVMPWFRTGDKHLSSVALKNADKLCREALCYIVPDSHDDIAEFAQYRSYST